ncbi:MAG: hypothetical protein KJ749_03475 [Planctomycetes bacterium]|nr:hypothetical protein [Planctomycetota bacterium]
MKTTTCTGTSATWMLLGVAFVGSPTASGDTLVAESLQGRYDLFEPVAISVTLRLDDPYLVILDDPVEATLQDRRVRRGLSAELRYSDTTVLKVDLGRISFQPDEDQATVVTVTVLIVLGELVPNTHGSVFTFWDSPGQYLLFVTDREKGIESNGVPITVDAPRGDLADAGELFRKGGVGTLLAIHNTRVDARVRNDFERLVSEHGNTPYGRYAKACLTLMQSEVIRASGTRLEPGERELLAAGLREVAASFEPGHPVRNRAWLSLAAVQRPDNPEEDPRDTLHQLLGETKDAYTVRSAKGMLRRMERLTGCETTSPSPPVSPDKP